MQEVRTPWLRGDQRMSARGKHMILCTNRMEAASMTLKEAPDLIAEEGVAHPMQRGVSAVQTRKTSLAIPNRRTGCAPGAISETEDQQAVTERRVSTSIGRSKLWMGSAPVL